MPRLRGIMSNLTDRSGDVEPERFYVLRFYFGGGRDILVCLMSDARRFPPPWSIIRPARDDDVLPAFRLSARTQPVPAIHSQLHRVFCASADTVGALPGAQMEPTEIPPPVSARCCPRCGTQMLFRVSRNWPTYIQRTYECPWCPHRMTEVVRSPMVNPPTPDEGLH